MEVLRIGSKGDDVRSLQILLTNNGFKSDVDGIFGEGTEDSVIAFQKKNNLKADGVVGKMTWGLLVGNSQSDKINKTRYILSTSNYEPTPFVKKNIVLHHTNGWTAVKGTTDQPSMNHISWWKSYWGEDNGRAKVATAFSIDHKGNIYQHFDPQMWAYHLGLGRSRNYLDRHSIGIELVNEGHMIKENDKYYWMSGEVKIPYNRTLEPVKSKKTWRGHDYFAPYPKEQVDATLWLVRYLCDKYKISTNFIEDNEYHEEILSGAFEGIYNHANVRAYNPNDNKKNKWDLSPAFDFKDFNAKLNG